MIYGKLFAIMAGIKYKQFLLILKAFCHGHKLFHADFSTFTIVIINALPEYNERRTIQCFKSVNELT